MVNQYCCGPAGRPRKKVNEVEDGVKGREEGRDLRLPIINSFVRIVYIHPNKTVTFFESYTDCWTGQLMLLISKYSLFFIINY